MEASTSEGEGGEGYGPQVNEAVLALKGQENEEEKFETVVDCDIDAFIPDGYIKNELNKPCYDTKCIYVKDVLSFQDAGTVDYIYKYMKDKLKFAECSGLAVSHLKARNLVEAARRWEELLNNENILDDNNIK